MIDEVERNVSEARGQNDPTAIGYEPSVIATEAGNGGKPARQGGRVLIAHRRFGSVRRTITLTQFRAGDHGGTENSSRLPFDFWNNANIHAFLHRRPVRGQRPVTRRGQEGFAKPAGPRFANTRQSKGFREAVLRGRYLGEYADATGAVCGQFAGAYWGESGIPKEWRDGLARPEMIERALQGLLKGKG
ncbi:MAG: ADP-ribosylglycohydrolase family protein [Pirellulaceae bacterium]